MSEDVREAGTGTPRVTPILAATAVVSAIAGFLYGYDTGIISGALLQITDEFGIGSGWQSVIATGILVGAVIGALVGARLSERFGRKRTILIISAVFVIGTLLASISPTELTLALSRVLLGMAVGGATQTVPMFVAELSPPQIRGRLVLAFQVAIGIGILTATIAGASQLLDWRLMIGLAAAPAALLFLLMLPAPESPRWLVKVDRVDEARSNLRRVRGEDDIEAELGDIMEVEEQRRQASARGWKGLAQPWVRPALIMGCGMALFTQLSGIEMIVYYTPTILTGVGFEESGALYVSVALAVTYVIMNVIGLAIVDRVGRRRLSLIMTPGAALALAVLGVVFLTGTVSAGSAPFIIACLIAFMFFTAGGLQVMGWLTGSEIYPLGVRGAGTSAQAATLWGSNVLITLTLLPTIEIIGVGPTMWMYAGFNVLAFVFVWRYFPEVAGRSLEDIEASLAEGTFHPGGVPIRHKGKETTTAAT
ncbi:MAG TPA: sugar porter family MFS transporter [Rubrobacter sp.]|nr:sugar porter family MFS transporter [Rubrobacter sp.]